MFRNSYFSGISVIALTFVPRSEAQLPGGISVDTY